MKQLAIVVPSDNIILSTVIGPYKIFNWVNDYLGMQGKKPAFDVKLIGLRPQHDFHRDVFSVKPHLTVDSHPASDVIVIPAFSFDPQNQLDPNKAFLPWIFERYKKGAAVVSLCTGAFLLAETGLLDGRRATTHWLYADVFRDRYPKVQLESEKIIIDEAGLYSSGGAFSFLNMMVYLVEKWGGKEMAIACSKIFEIEYRRDSQLPFFVFSGLKQHSDEPVKKAQELIEQRWNDKVTVSELADQVAVSRRNFERRFKKATGHTPASYMQWVKIEMAKKDLELGVENVNEVMYKVGYQDEKAFREGFRRVTGLSPMAYKNRYRREA